MTCSRLLPGRSSESPRVAPPCARKKHPLVLLGGGVLICFGALLHYWFLRLNDWLGGA